MSALRPRATLPLLLAAALAACGGGTPPDATEPSRNESSASGVSDPGPAPGATIAPPAPGATIAPPATAPPATAGFTVAWPAPPPPEAPLDEAQPRRDPRLADASAAMQRRSGTASSGGYLIVVRGDEIVHEESFGGASRTTLMNVASTTKSLTGMLVLTFVDEGRLGLDDPISRWLPEFGDGDEALITVRHLLNHTSGIRQQDCIWNGGAVMADCVAQLGRGTLQFRPGSAFSYGNASYHVAGRLIEAVTGRRFLDVFEERIATPLGFTGTDFGGNVDNPSPAAGIRTTVADHLRFLELLHGGGEIRGRRLLSPESVRELQTDQIRGYDTAGDQAVGITRIPRYGFGLWLDHVDADHRTVVASGNGATGFYPWVDHRTGTYGIVAVDDRRGAEVAVPASKAVLEAVLTGLN